MDPAEYRCPEAGAVIHLPTGYDAFVPAPVPPALIYDSDLVLALSRADAALSELSGLGRHMPNPQLLIGPYVRREAVLSSRIEGTRASLSDVLLNELDENLVGTTPADVHEVRNYVTALEFGIGRLQQLPLSLRLVREIHEQLLSGMGSHLTPGQFRRSQNWIGATASTPATARYVPPPPAQMMACLGNWEQFLHVHEQYPDLIQCALMHEHFEAIHPFLDGNGRVGRLLITLFLIERGRLAQPLLYLSDYVERHRQEYYDLLHRVRTECDWQAWLLYFLAGVTETARSAIDQASQLVTLRENVRHQLRAHAKALVLLDQLFTNPYVTVQRAMQILQASDPTARKVVAVLQEHGMLEEITGGAWRRIYVATPILKILEQQTPPSPPSE